MPLLLSSEAEFGQKMAVPTTTLVEFSGPNCIICKKLEPMLDTAAKRAKQVDVVKVDASELADVAEQYAVRSVPTLILFRGGNVLDRKTGFVTADELLRWLDEHTGAEATS